MAKRTIKLSNKKIEELCAQIKQCITNDSFSKVDLPLFLTLDIHLEPGMHPICVRKWASKKMDQIDLINDGGSTAKPYVSCKEQDFIENIRNFLIKNSIQLYV